MQASVARSREGIHMLGVIAWAVFVVAGWIVFAYVAFATPGGLATAWSSVRSLPLVVQLLMWALLLPWMVALWVWSTSWALWLRALLVVGLWWASMVLSIPQLVETFKSR